MMDEGKQETKIHKYTFDNLKRSKKWIKRKYGIDRLVL